MYFINVEDLLDQAMYINTTNLAHIWKTTNKGTVNLYIYTHTNLHNK